jgi:hypothetical protein
MDYQSPIKAKSSDLEWIPVADTNTFYVADELYDQVALYLRRQLTSKDIWRNRISGTEYQLRCGGSKVVESDKDGSGSVKEAVVEGGFAAVKVGGGIDGIAAVGGKGPSSDTEDRDCVWCVNVKTSRKSESFGLSYISGVQSSHGGTCGGAKPRPSLAQLLNVTALCDVACNATTLQAIIHFAAFDLQTEHLKLSPKMASKLRNAIRNKVLP